MRVRTVWGGATTILVCFQAEVLVGGGQRLLQGLRSWRGAEFNDRGAARRGANAGDGAMMLENGA